MRNVGNLQVSTPSDTTILLERVFNAPRAHVWRAMSEPELVKRWYGPRGFEMTVCEIDFRVGGAWRYVLRMPNGNLMGQSGEYVEIVKPERIVNTEGLDGFEGTILVTYTLVEAGGSTTMQCLSECHTKELRDTIASSGMEHGAAASYDKLAELLSAI
jgi:uncharacterized protein YndB with AHSA1/START domain